MKRRTLDGDEADVTSRKWRRRFNSFVRKPGVIAEVKRRMRHRERHEARHAVRGGVDEIEALTAELIEEHNEHWHPGRSCGPHDRCKPVDEEVE